jgi:hypothetical protein
MISAPYSESSPRKNCFHLDEQQKQVTGIERNRNSVGPHWPAMNSFVRSLSELNSPETNFRRYWPANPAAPMPLPPNPIPQIRTTARPYLLFYPPQPSDCAGLVLIS